MDLAEPADGLGDLTEGRCRVHWRRVPCRDGPDQRCHRPDPASAGTGTAPTAVGPRRSARRRGRTSPCSVPFLPVAALTPTSGTGSTAIAAAVEPFEVRFERVRRFPGVVWLDPEPAEPFRSLTAAIVARWPDHPPYGGVFDEVIPH